MYPTRTKIVVAIGWFLFWVLMVSVAVQDYLRDDGSALWQPLVWESSSMITATVLVLLQHRATVRYNHLLPTPLRWFAIQEKLRTLLRQAQLQRLTQQMQPHFLFNALNTVSSLMRSDVEKADATLIQLAEELRATLDASEQPETTLDAELRLVRACSRVMEERFAGRVTVSWDIADAARALNGRFAERPYWQLKDKSSPRAPAWRRTARSGARAFRAFWRSGCGTAPHNGSAR